MFTQCPACKTIFEVAPAQLAVAAGTVRCGECGKTFNALRFLAESPVDFEVPPANATPPAARENAPKTVPTTGSADNDRGDDAERPARAAADGDTAETLSDETDAARKNEAEQEARGEPTKAEDDADRETSDSDSIDDESLAAAEPTESKAEAEDDADYKPATADSTGDELLAAAEPTESKAEAEDDADYKPAMTDSTGDELLAAAEPNESKAEAEDDADYEPATADSTGDELLAAAEPTQAEDDADRETSDSDSIDDEPLAAAEPTESKAEAEDDADYEPAMTDSTGDELLAAAEPTQAEDDTNNRTTTVDQPTLPKDGTDKDLVDPADDADYAATGDEEIILDDNYAPPEMDDDEFLDEEDWVVDDEPAESGATSAIAPPLPELRPGGSAEIFDIPEKLEGGAAALDHTTRSAVPDLASSPAANPASELRNNDAIDAEDARDLRDYLQAPASSGLARLGWLSACLFLLGLLVVQVIHQHRGDLVLHPRFGGAISTIYSLFGKEIRPNWHVDDYKVVGQARLMELPADISGENPEKALRFVAIIANRAERPQPAPMVRLTLRDRWGDATGARDFSPPEYLTDRSLVEQLLEPGQRLRVVLNLQDPGTEVVGFDFDMCLPDVEGVLRCASEPRVAARR